MPGGDAAGDVFRLGRLVSGGSRNEVRGLLATKREVKELRERVAAEHEAAAETGSPGGVGDEACWRTNRTIAALGAVLHGHEKAAIGSEVQVQRAGDDLERVARRLEMVASERRRADEERRAQTARQDEARETIARHEELQRGFDARVDEVQAAVAVARDELATTSGTRGRGEGGTRGTRGAGARHSPTTCGGCRTPGANSCSASPGEERRA